ncbi:zinc-binding metallopeptidase [Terrimonas pollutisoli]|uniref:zinc-binding metallopeptidase n=1 Tax=Terrimonas pollutisoli TaxID=3034147 RepID=UPI0023EB70FE|nr:putative zinc-binding metallopeptidase [Terrimonas sp. H1YJ31]
MRFLNISLTVILFSFAVTSCEKEDALNVDDIPGLGGDTWVKGPIDQWLYDTLTVPFNIATKYKWDQFELEVNKTIVPPKEEKVIPVMRAVKKTWIDPYVSQAGELFFKKYSPKFFVLAGSASWNLDGSITLGTAEGGRKVVLYLLNDFKNKTMPGYVPADSVVPKQMFHVIHHEFGHVLDQTIRRPVEFDAVCAGFYSSDWINTNDAEAMKDGFITAYALSNPFEDFVEMVSIMLIEGRSGFDRMVNGITGTSVRGTTPEEAKARLRLKESIVVNYFKQAWSIDFYSLQTRVRTAIQNEIY